MKTMMKNKDSDSLRAIRMLLATVKQKEIDGRCELVDSEVLSIVNKTIKQCRGAISKFAKAGRNDLVAKELSEIKSN